MTDGNKQLSVVNSGTIVSTIAEDSKPANATGNELELAINALRAQANNFGLTFINDSAVRANYIQGVTKAINEIIELVKTKKITPHEGALTANQIRNQIMELARAKLSDYGLSISKDMKQTGLLIEDLQNKYSTKRYSKSFNLLTNIERNVVHMDIIEAAGRTNSKVNLNAKYFGIAGRALLIMSLGISVYSVIEAEDKTRQVSKELTVVGSGVAGGAAGGAFVAFLVTNPAGWMTAAGMIVIGGIVSVFSGQAFDYFWPETKKK
jgi:hypothetical protein